MKLLKKQRQAIRSRASKIYNKPFIFVTCNITGIFISLLGIIVCIAMIVGSYMLHSTTKTQTRSIETTIYTYLDKGDDGLDQLQTAVDGFTPATDFVQEVSDVADENIDRLQTLKLSLIAFNFGNNLDTPIEKIDDVIDALKQFQDLPQFILESKEKINGELKELKEKIEETRTQVEDGATRVRRVTFYTFLASFILAGIFFVGEYTLLSRCVSALKKHRKNRMHNVTSESDPQPLSEFDGEAD